MIELLREWYRRHFTDPQVVILAFLLLAGLLVIILAGRILAPVLTAIIFAYLLDGAVQKLVRFHIPRLLAVTLIFLVFVALMIAALFSVVPLMSQQVAQLVRALPDMISEGQSLLLQLPERYPQLISDEQVVELMGAIRSETTLMGQRVLSFSLASARHLVDVVIYLVVVPIMVFFILKDRDLILDWARSFVPRDSRLAGEVWGKVNLKIGSYVRGKFIEILIVWAVSFVTFSLLGLNYAMLLSFMIGVSVIIPYIGTVVATFPVAVVAYSQFGFGSEFLWIMVAYGVIQFLDGNVLVPLLFSEVVNLHPTAIIAAVFVFGGIWGLWGVFFAIPLATLVHAVLQSWPKGDPPETLPLPGPAAARVGGQGEEPDHPGRH